MPLISVLLMLSCLNLELGSGIDDEEPASIPPCHTKFWLDYPQNKLVCYRKTLSEAYYYGIYLSTGFVCVFTKLDELQSRKLQVSDCPEKYFRLGTVLPEGETPPPVHSARRPTVLNAVSCPTNSKKYRTDKGLVSCQRLDNGDFLLINFYNKYIQCSIPKQYSKMVQFCSPTLLSDIFEEGLGGRPRPGVPDKLLCPLTKDELPNTDHYAICETKRGDIFIKKFLNPSDYSESQVPECTVPDEFRSRVGICSPKNLRDAIVESVLQKHPPRTRVQCPKNMKALESKRTYVICRREDTGGYVMVKMNKRTLLCEIPVSYEKYISVCSADLIRDMLYRQPRFTYLVCPASAAQAATDSLLVCKGNWLDLKDRQAENYFIYDQNTKDMECSFPNDQFGPLLKVCSKEYVRDSILQVIGVPKPCNETECAGGGRCVDTGAGTHRCECAGSGQDPLRDCAACQAGEYGADCSKTCGRCGSGTCDPVTGQCDLCEPGYQLPMCQLTRRGALETQQRQLSGSFQAETPDRYKIPEQYREEYNTTYEHFATYIKESIPTPIQEFKIMNISYDYTVNVRKRRYRRNVRINISNRIKPELVHRINIRQATSNKQGKITVDFSVEITVSPNTHSYAQRFQKNLKKNAEKFNDENELAIIASSIEVRETRLETTGSSATDGDPSTVSNLIYVITAAAIGTLILAAILLAIMFSRKSHQQLPAFPNPAARRSVRGAGVRASARVRASGDRDTSNVSYWTDVGPSTQDYRGTGRGFGYGPPVHGRGGFSGQVFGDGAAGRGRSDYSTRAFGVADRGRSGFSGRSRDVPVRGRGDSVRGGGMLRGAS